MHKRFLSITATATLLALGIAIAGAQDTPQNGAQAGAPQGEHNERMGPRHRMSPEEQLQRMGERLNLTDDQKNQIKPILEDRQKQMEALHAETSGSQEDRRAKMRSIMEDSNTKIRGILNDDQKQKFDQMQQRMRERTRKPGGPEGGQAPPQ